MMMRRVVFGLVLLGLVSCGKSKREEEAEAFKEMERSRLEMADRMKMTDEGLEVDFEAIDEHKKDMLKSADKVGGDMGAILKIIADLQGPLTEAGKACEAQTPLVIEALNWKALAEDGDYEGRRGNLERCIEVNRKCMEVYEAFAPEVIRRVKALGMKDAELKDFEKGFVGAQGEMRGMIQTIRGCDIEISELGIAMLDRLEKAGEGWKWDGATEQILLEDDADVERFGEKFTAMEEVAAKQKAAQEEFVRMLRTKS